MSKLIAIDLDGTLLDSKHQISEENIKALHFAERQGHKIVICTGRPYASMKSFVEAIGFTSEDDYIITFNGGQIQKARDGTIVIADRLSVSDLNVWYPSLTEALLPLNVIDQDYIYEPLHYPKGHDSIYVTEQTSAPVMKKDYLTFDSTHEFSKFIIAVEPAHLASQIETVNDELRASYALTWSYPHLLEIANQGVSKGEAVRRLSDELNVERENIIAIGDQLNDLSMIDYAGVGVAMENAVPEIKENADFITRSNDEDGVAYAMYHFL